MWEKSFTNEITKLSKEKSHAVGIGATIGGLGLGALHAATFKRNIKMLRAPMLAASQSPREYVLLDSALSNLKHKSLLPGILSTAVIGAGLGAGAGKLYKTIKRDK